MISVLLPTRGRPQSLHKSIHSLMDLAANPDGVEILLATDPDEGPLAATGFPGLPVREWVAPERYGYMQLHRYLNPLAAMARGEWLLSWNDDACMETRNWDAIIEAEPCDAMLLIGANHSDSFLFPVWPALWSRLTGHACLSMHLDLWIDELSGAIGRQREVPVEVRHDRFDITGQNGDATYQEGRAQLGSYGNHPSHDSPEVRLARAQDIRTLMEHYMDAG